MDIIFTVLMANHTLYALQIMEVSSHHYLWKWAIFHPRTLIWMMSFKWCSVTFH